MIDPSKPGQNQEPFLWRPDMAKMIDASYVTGPGGEVMLYSGDASLYQAPKPARNKRRR